MNSRELMDLSSSSSPACTDFIDFDQTQRISDSGLEEIVPSYDFQPIRSTTTSSSVARVCSASDCKPSSTWPWSNRQDLTDSIEPTKLLDENVTILCEIDRRMKKHTDPLLHVLEGVSARLTQLETTTHNLENLLHDLKLSLDNNTHASTDAQVRHLQNILVEVQTGMQLFKDKQEIFEAQLQVSKVDRHPNTHSLHVDPTALSPSSPPLAQLPTHFSPPPKHPPNPPRQHPPPAPQPRPSMYDGAGGTSSSGFPSAYSPEPYPHTGSHLSSSRTGYPQLSNVIDRVTTMGFPREQVRATVIKLTENAQAVDLNVVLDKLMNQGAGAPPGAWFGGR